MNSSFKKKNKIKKNNLSTAQKRTFQRTFGKTIRSSKTKLINGFGKFDGTRLPKRENLICHEMRMVAIMSMQKKVGVHLT